MKRGECAGSRVDGENISLEGGVKVKARTALGRSGWRLNLGDDDELAVGGEVPAKVLQKYREGRAETQRYMSAVALTTATGTEEGGRLPGRVSRATIKMGGGSRIGTGERDREKEWGR